MDTALDAIIKNYVLKEIKHETHHAKDNVKSSGKQLYESDEDYIQALHECLEKKGVMRDLQGFLRRKLVLILQEKWPKLSVQPPIELISPVVIKLIQDFLCCRKFLYSFSVLSGEIGLKSKGKAHFGKLSCLAVEDLLEQLGIKKDSQISRNILKCYCNNEGISLLECLIQFNAFSKNKSCKNNDTSVSVSDENQQPQVLPKVEQKKYQKLDKRFRQIDAFYDSQQKKEVNVNQIQTDERFRKIERELEKNKNFQIQQAIKKFREEEISKIKEELQHKSEFEILTKENELLKNYKEKSQCLKESLELEKAEHEKEYAQKQQELETMMDSIVKEKLKLQAYSKSLPTSTSPQVEVQGENSTQQEPQSLPMTSPLNIAKKYAQQINDPVFQEAQLQVTIKRLQRENEQLLAERESRCERQEKVIISHCNCRENNQPQRHQNHEPPTKEWENTPKFSQQVDADKVAFLQYNLEKQSEEIKLLKQQLYLDSQSTLPTSAEKESGILKFLTASKKRCEQIESEAKSIDQKLNEIRCRKSRPSSPFIQPRQIPQNSPFAFMEEFQCSNFNVPHQPLSPIFQRITHPQNPPLQGTPKNTNPWSENQLKRNMTQVQGQKAVLPNTTLSINRASLYEEDLQEQRQFTRIQSSTHHLRPGYGLTQTQVSPPENQSKSNKRDDQSDIIIGTNGTGNPDAIISHPRKNPSKSKRDDPIDIIETNGTRDPDASNYPEESPISHSIIASEQSKSHEREKVEKAVKKGALSFEKVVTSDEESSRQDISSTNLNMGASPEKLVEKNSEEPKVQQQISFPKKFKASSEEDKSISISAPHDISQGSNDPESDFWKL